MIISIGGFLHANAFLMLIFIVVMLYAIIYNEVQDT